jgi:predicted permease
VRCGRACGAVPSGIIEAMSKSPSLLSLFAIVAALMAFGFVGARYMVGAHSEKTLAQLSIVWPNIEAMPDNERNFLVELALTCNVTQRQAVRAEVLDCLRSTAPTLGPKAVERLDHLVVQAPPASKQP